MNIDDPSIENSIKLLFSSDIQQKRVKKELQGISALNQRNYKINLQASQLGLKILVELPEETLTDLIKDPVQLTFPVVFEIFLDNKFPFVSPRLYCKTDFFKPSLADGRDYTDDVVEKLWTPAILIKDVIIMLLKFIKKVNRIATPEELQVLGKYYLEKFYDLEDFFALDSVVVFPAKEVLNDKGKTEDRFLIVTDTFFLNFVLQDKSTNCIKLLSVANIKSIANIKKNKDDHKTLVFTFHDKSKQSGIAQNVFLVDEAQKLVDSLISIGQKYGMKVNKTVRKLQDLSLEEVTAKSYENVDIEELLEDITILESRLETDISVDVINLLMTFYQKTIEYLSAFNDPAFEDFVKRLHSLLQRKDVQVILQSQQESPSLPGSTISTQSRSSGSGRRPADDDDDEEEKKEGPAGGRFRMDDDLANKNPFYEEEKNKIKIGDAKKSEQSKQDEGLGKNRDSEGLDSNGTGTAESGITFD